MKHWKKYGLGLILALLFPYTVTLFLNGSIVEPEIQLSYSGKQIELEGEMIDAEQFLIYVLASQMPADYEAEAWKAQAVLSRSALYKSLEEGAARAEDTGLFYWTLEEMKKQWGGSFSDNYGKIEQAVAQTACQTIRYEGAYIENFCHRASAGKTRSGGEAYPYLPSVESNDVDMENYLVIQPFTNEELAKKLNEKTGTNEYSASGLNETIQIGSRDEAGYVTSLQIGQKEWTGADFAEALSLSSESFTVQQQPDGVKMICSGSGSGYGLSQWGANRMAKEGKTFEEILNYYFQNIEIHTDL